MAYNPNIPQSTDQLSVSQGQILQNFQSLQTNLNKNHVDLNNALEGLHKYVQMPNITTNAIVVPAIGANEMATYSDTYAKTAQTEVFIRKQAASTAPASSQQVPMTAARFNASGYCYLPSGLLMKWGQITVPVINLNTTVNFNVDPSIPVFAVAPYNVQVTIASLPAITNLSAMIGTITATQFNIYCRAISAVVGANVPVNWFAIGVGA